MSTYATVLNTVCLLGGISISIIIENGVKITIIENLGLNIIFENSSKVQFFKLENNFETCALLKNLILA